jgi:bacteriocin biosynthesis cyclodehydratase domain-containing protein
MPTLKLNRPKLPTNIYVWSEPPDTSGDETLHFISERRRVKLKGHSFREFCQFVLPLLDGHHTLEEIAQEVAHVFERADLEAALQLMTEQHLLEDAEGATLPADLVAQICPQLNFFQEMEIDSAQTQERLSGATVTVLGLGGAGAAVALSLAAARVGNIRCADVARVSMTDSYFSPVFAPTDTGAYRAHVVKRRIEMTAPQVRVAAYVQALEADEDLQQIILGADFIICALDAGLSSLIYKLNRVCLKETVRWTSCALSGAEIIFGPTVHPFETACYLCYKMRAVACAANPEDEFALASFLDNRKRDDGSRRENTVFGAGIAAGLLGLEALKELSGVFQPTAAGKIFVLNLLDLTWTRHVVLREPACPACFQPHAGDAK